MLAETKQIQLTDGSSTTRSLLDGRAVVSFQGHWKVKVGSSSRVLLPLPLMQLMYGSVASPENSC